MDFEQLIQQRYSVRAFLSDPVPEPVIRDILRAAQRTPSWCNTQPWLPVVTLTPSATDRFRETLWDHVQSGGMPRPDYPFPGKYQGACAERRKQCGAALYGALGIPREDKRGAMAQTLKNFRLFEAPHMMMVFCHESLGFYGGVDCGLFIHGFMLAALNRGVGTVAQAALATYPDFVREYFGIDPAYRLLFGCSFGFADENDPVNQYRTDRAHIDETVRWVRA
ncbi:MAG: nitroreductase [Pseudomonadota bacterium]|nr:nitroreductase [Pseudomonadota bacterium]